MGNLTGRPNIKFKFKSSCCTTVVTTPDDQEPGFDIQLSVENGEDIHDRRPELQRQDSAIESNTEQKKRPL